MWIMDFLFTSLQTPTRPLDEHLLWAPLEIFLSHREAAGMRGQKNNNNNNAAAPSSRSKGEKKK